MFRREFTKSLFALPFFSSLKVKESEEEVKVVDKRKDTCSIFEFDGTQRFYKNGELHRDGDKPAVICANGEQHFYENGKFHRDGDKPAVIFASGAQRFYKNGKLHRDGDKPAIIWADGAQHFYKNGKLHRKNGTDAIWADGEQIYRI